LSRGQHAHIERRSSEDQPGQESEGLHAAILMGRRPIVKYVINSAAVRG
jgi:hypothetical protein